MPETIFAVSSGAPPAAIAIIRISGTRAFATVAALAGSLPTPRRAVVRTLRETGGTVLDRALVIVFPGPDSATGEDLAELHVHGGRAVVAAVQSALASVQGLRPAEPGEFTRRALLNGRIDLTEAEGLADLLAAETEAQRRSALSNADGALRRRVEGWTTRTISMAARVEAAIDHEDEEDIDEMSIVAPVCGEASALAVEIDKLLAMPRSERLRDGIKVVLAGPPNSGKSSLFNVLIGRDGAIVSDVAGTTRDLIEAPIVRAGIAWLFTDTAGLADRTDDPIEAIGIDRAGEAIASADVVLWLGDAEPPVPDMIVLNPRCDVVGRETATGRLSISVRTGSGLDDLWHCLAQRAQTLLPQESATVLNARQAAGAADASRALRQAGRASDPLLIAEELRVALRSFDGLTGRAHTEAVLDDLFGRFCIGK